MAIQKFFCNGCGTELKDATKENTANQALRKTYLDGIADEMQKRNTVLMISNDDFCANCRTKAAAFWDGKMKIMAEQNELLNNRLAKHYNLSFRQSNLSIAGKK